MILQKINPQVYRTMRSGLVYQISKEGKKWVVNHISIGCKRLAECYHQMASFTSFNEAKDYLKSNTREYA